MSALSDFLMKNSITASAEMPIVHSTQAYFLTRVISDNALKPSPCNSFLGETLNYFFYGKPAYKKVSDSNQAQVWELPLCFILEIDALKTIKRIYPFDSGAFKAGRFPSYISMIQLSEFEATPVVAEPVKLIGAFFGSVSDYFRLKSYSEDTFQMKYGLNVTDAEILALHKLAGDSSLPRTDDRRFCIEIQTEDTIALNPGNVRAIILPSEYLDDVKVLKHITDVWQATPIAYEASSLSLESYTSEIYSKLSAYYKSEGIL